MSYRLRDSLGFCTVDGTTFFLDVHTNRYFRLGAAAELPFQTFIAHDASRNHVPVELRPLADRGIIVGDSWAGWRPPNPPSPPTAELSLVADSAIPAMLVARAGMAQLHFAVMMRVRALYAIASHIRNRRRNLIRTRGSAEPIYRAATAAIARFDPLWGASDRCLVRSLAFLALAMRQGHAPQLVFGVQARPFSAHCWVDDSGMVVNDRLENVRPYTPILAI